MNCIELNLEVSLLKTTVLVYQIMLDSKHKLAGTQVSLLYCWASQDKTSQNFKLCIYILLHRQVEQFSRIFKYTLGTPFLDNSFVLISYTCMYVSSFCCALPYKNQTLLFFNWIFSVINKDTRQFNTLVEPQLTTIWVLVIIAFVNKCPSRNSYLYCWKHDYIWSYFPLRTIRLKNQ